jgi:sensor domain CHASE-containing protein
VTVRTKISATITLAFSVLVTAIYILYSGFVMRDYTEIEHSQMQTNLKRVELAVESVQKQLLATTKDWAWWDDTHKFMIDKNEEFRESWFTLDSFKALNITHAAFFDLEQNVDFGVLVDFENETVTELSDKSEVTPSVIKEKFIKFSTSKEPTYGLVEIEGKILLVASAPIMDTARSKPSNGVLVLAMTAGEAFIRMLADQTQLNLVTIDLTKGAVALTDSEYIDKLKGGQNQIVKIVSDNAISGYSLLRDIEQKPLLVIRNDSSRPIYERSGENAK